MITLRQQIDYCKSRIAKGDKDHQQLRAIMDSLLIADKCDLIPKEIDGKDYKRFLDIYFQFRVERKGYPKMNPAAGKALKDIIRYLLKIGKAKDDPDNATEPALKSWQFILHKDNWNLLSDFIKSQVGLIQINKHIEEIIEQLTHASKKARNSHNDSEAERLENAIRDRRKSGAD